MARDARIDRLEEVLERLAEAQGRTETTLQQMQEGLRQLTEAQARTEATLQHTQDGLRQLVQAQARTEAALQHTQDGLQQLTEAQARTEAALQQTQEDLRRLARQVGGLSDAIGGDIEDIAYIVLHDVLAREFGWEVGVLERTWEPWEGEEEVDIFGRAADPARPGQTIWIVGEAKHNLTLGEVERFARRIERARRRLAGEVFAVCFAYRVRPEVRARLRELAIPLVFSYGRTAS
jgi:uncharacterized phage infection (PIP) family protein YhgE